MTVENNKTHQVCYKYALYPTPPQQILLDQFYKVSNKASDIFSEAFLNLFGGIRPENLVNARYKMEQRNKQKKDINYNFYPDCVTLFFYWFSLEDLENSDPRLHISPEEVYPLFEARCQELKVPIDFKWGLALKATTLSVQQNCFNKQPGQDLETKVWINRIKGNSILAQETGLTPEVNAWFFQDVTFPFQDEEITSMSYCRGLFSEIWQHGKKSDWNISKNVSSRLRKFINLPIDTIYQSCIKELNIPEGTSASKINKTVLGKKGRPDNLANFLSGGKNEQIKEGKCKQKDFISWLDDSVGKSDFKIGKPESEFYANLLNKIIKDTNLCYDLDFFCDFASKAIERLRSHRSNSLNTLNRRYNLDLNKPEISKELESTIEEWIENKEQFCLTYGDVAGINDVRSFCENEITISNLLSAINTIENNPRHRRANYALLKTLAQYPCPNWFDVILNYQSYSQNRYDFNRLRTPTFAKFQNKPNHPQYGESRPTAKFDSNKKIFTLSILGQNGKTDILVKGANKRAFAEIYNANGEKNAPRKTRLTSKAYDIEDINKIKSTALEKGYKLVKKDEKIYVYLNYTLNNKPLVKREDLAKMPEGFRFMGVDPGIRKNMTYSIGEVTRVPLDKQNLPYFIKDGIPYVKIGDKNWIKIIERGCLKETDFKRNNGRIICRLHSESSCQTEQIEQDYWKFLVNNQIVSDQLPCPDKFIDFFKKVTEALKYYWKITKNPDIDTVKKLTDLMKYRNNIGDVSYTRILALKDLKSIYQSVNSRYKNNGLDWLVNSLNYVTDKIYNIRQERCRRSVNLMAAKALDHKVKALFLEETCLDIHSRMPKFMMKRIDIWTPRNILELCKQQLNPLGINVYLRNSELSSHKDFLDGTLHRARYDDLSPAVIKEEIKYYRQMKNLNGFRKKLYFGEIKDLLARNGMSFENASFNETTRFPRLGGKLFPSKALGWIDADENASMYFLIDGLKWLISPKSPTARGNKPKNPKLSKIT